MDRPRSPAHQVLAIAAAVCVSSRCAHAQAYWNSVNRPPFSSSPNVADLDGEGSYDIVAGTRTGRVPGGHCLSPRYRTPVAEHF